MKDNFNKIIMPSGSIGLYKIIREIKNFILEMKFLIIG